MTGGQRDSPPARLQPGVGSFAFGWAVARGTPPLNEHGLLRFAQEHGVGTVQIADNLPVHTWPAERLARFVAAARDAGIGIELGARGLTDEHLARYLDLCARSNARLLRFVADAHPYEPSPEALIAILRRAAPALEDAGVTLALENHDRFPAAVLREIVEQAGSASIGVCLDTANSLGAGEGLEAVTRLLAPLTVNLHVKDISIRRLPHMMGFIVEGRPLGEGQLPIGWAMRQVEQGGRCRTVILEGWTPEEASVAATLAREEEWAARGIETLKRFLAAPAAGS